MTASLAFFDDSQRLFYVIPMGRRSVIGTTDTRVDDPHTAVTAEDRNFLLEQINARMNLEKPLEASDVIAERSGVRPLVVKVEGEGSDDWRSKEWTSLSRRHEVECDAQRSVVTVFGGKLTDCLNVGAEVASKIESLGVALEADQRNWYGSPIPRVGQSSSVRRTSCISMKCGRSLIPSRCRFDCGVGTAGEHSTCSNTFAMTLDGN